VKIGKNDVNSTNDSINLQYEPSQKSEHQGSIHQDIYNKIKELLYLARPIIYMIALNCCKEKSFIPLIISSVMDYLYLDPKLANRGNFSKQKVYFAEMSYRYRRLWLYLLREPIVSTVTIPFIRKIFGILRLPETILNWVEIVIRYFTKYYYIL
jgi:hypothetical protein